MSVLKRVFAFAAAVLVFGLVGCRKNVSSDPVSEKTGKTENLKSSGVEAANKMAADGKKLFDIFLADADANGYGVGRDTLNTDVVAVSAKNGVWSCVIDDIYGYGFTDKISWSGSANGITAKTTADGAKYAEELLCVKFADKYKDLKNAAFVFVIFNGKCTGAIYLDVPYGAIDKGFEIFDLGINGGQFPAGYKWSGGEAGIVVSKETGKTYVVGTSPIVEMNDAAVVRHDDDAHTYAYRNAKAVYGSLNHFLDGIEERGLRLNRLDEPHTLLIEVSYGGYRVDFDDELMVDAESMGKFSIRLVNAVEEEYHYSDAWIKAYIVKGKCEGVVFMSSGGDYDHPSYEDFKKGSYRWDGADDIGYVNGIAMGVYPELPYSEN